MLPAKAVLERIAKVPGLRKGAEEISLALLPDLKDRDARDAATASAVDLSLRAACAQQGQQVTKTGESTYRRY